MSEKSPLPVKTFYSPESAVNILNTREGFFQIELMGNSPYLILTGEERFKDFVFGNRRQNFDQRLFATTCEGRNVVTSGKLDGLFGSLAVLVPGLAEDEFFIAEQSIDRGDLVSAEKVYSRFEAQGSMPVLLVRVQLDPNGPKVPAPTNVVIDGGECVNKGNLGPCEAVMTARGRMAKSVVLNGDRRRDLRNFITTNRLGEEIMQTGKLEGLFGIRVHTVKDLPDDEIYMFEERDMIPTSAVEIRAAFEAQGPHGCQIIKLRLTGCNTPVAA